MKDTAYDEVKTANAAAGHDQAYSDIKVPLLEDVLSWAVKKDFLINIELKNNIESLHCLQHFFFHSLIADHAVF